MILTFLFSIFTAFLGFIISFLPAGNLPTAITTSFSYLLSIVNAFSFIIPVDTLLQAAAVILVFDGAMVLWYFVNWVIRKIPGMQ